MENRDKSAWGGFILMLIFIAAFLVAAQGQSGNFSEINGEEGRASVHYYRSGALAINHNGHKWVEQVDSVSSENPKLLEVFTRYARWELWYDRFESGGYNKHIASEAWCFQLIGDPIHYR